MKFLPKLSLIRSAREFVPQDEPISPWTHTDNEYLINALSPINLTMLPQTHHFHINRSTHSHTHARCGERASRETANAHSSTQRERSRPTGTSFNNFSTVPFCCLAPAVRNKLEINCCYRELRAAH
jgi:hypothetical protein